jgi:23S rRNA (uracil1939-C5)-methyltransferase
MVWFVDGSLPGELVRVEPGRRRRSHHQGRLVEVIEAADERVVPPCDRFGVCGGCVLQHLDYRAQVAGKEKSLLDSLERIGRTVPEHLDSAIVGEPWGYRRKARLGVRFVPSKGGVLVGFRERHKSFVTPLDDCLTLRPEAARLLPGLRDLISRLERPDRLPQVEVAVADNATAIVIRHLERLGDDERGRIESFARQEDIQVYLQAGGVDSVRPLWPQQPEPLRYRLAGLEAGLQFQPTDFIQVNGTVNEALVRRAIDWMAPSPAETVLDLFCGIGNFSLPLACRAGRVIGIEGEAGLVAQARANAARNRIGNIEFRVADLQNYEGCAPAAPASVDALLVDPPRTGAMDVVRDLVPRLNPDRIVYVSCNPATLARDAEILVRRHGYRLSRAAIADMFPHTAHVESIALFRKR